MILTSRPPRLGPFVVVIVTNKQLHRIHPVVRLASDSRFLTPTFSRSSDSSTLVNANFISLLPHGYLSLRRRKPSLTCTKHAM